MTNMNMLLLKGLVMVSSLMLFRCTVAVAAAGARTYEYCDYSEVKDLFASGVRVEFATLINPKNKRGS